MRNWVLYQEWKSKFESNKLVKRNDNKISKRKGHDKKKSKKNELSKPSKVDYRHDLLKFKFKILFYIHYKMNLISIKINSDKLNN